MVTQACTTNTWEEAKGGSGGQRHAPQYGELEAEAFWAA